MNSAVLNILLLIGGLDLGVIGRVKIGRSVLNWLLGIERGECVILMLLSMGNL